MQTTIEQYYDCACKLCCKKCRLCDNKALKYVMCGKCRNRIYGNHIPFVLARPNKHYINGESFEWSEF